MLKGKSRARISRSVQRYFPQCAACCSKQASAAKSGATRLVFHFYGMRPWYYTGEPWGGCPQSLHNLKRGVRSTLQQAGRTCGKQARPLISPLVLPVASKDSLSAWSDGAQCERCHKTSGHSATLTALNSKASHCCLIHRPNTAGMI